MYSLMNKWKLSFSSDENQKANTIVIFKNKIFDFMRKFVLMQNELLFSCLLRRLNVKLSNNKRQIIF
jgi:hypothetical protein